MKKPISVELKVYKAIIRKSDEYQKGDYIFLIGWFEYLKIKPNGNLRLVGLEKDWLEVSDVYSTKVTVEILREKHFTPRFLRSITKESIWDKM